MKQIVAIVILAYLAIGFLTFGYLYNNYECDYDSLKPLCERHRDRTSFGRAVFWPVYWAGRGAIEITK